MTVILPTGIAPTCAPQSLQILQIDFSHLPFELLHTIGLAVFLSLYRRRVRRQNRYEVLELLRFPQEVSDELFLVRCSWDGSDDCLVSTVGGRERVRSKRTFEDFCRVTVGDVLRDGNIDVDLLEVCLARKVAKSRVHDPDELFDT